MWKPLNASQCVCPGDQVRYAGAEPFSLAKTLFKVVKADLHYFEILPAIQVADAASVESFARKIVRYFDIGYTICLEVWIE